MNVQRRAKLMSRIVLMLLQQQNLTGAKITKASRGARHLSLGLKLFDSTELDKALKLAEAVALASNSESVIAQRQAGLIIYQFQLNPGFWEYYTRDDLPSSQAVGLAEMRKPVLFSFENDPHSLIAGTTGSGKTETIKSTLIALINVYSPDELKLAICDPNDMLGDFENEAHLALPIAKSYEDMKQVLLFCNRELAHRKAESIKDDYILVLVFDEATETLLTDADKAIAKNIVKQGRAFRVNAIVGTQRPTQTDLPGIVDMLLNRFVGKVDNAQTSANLTGHSGLMAHKLTGKGDFLHITNGGDATRFQVAVATSTDFAKLERAEIKPINFTEQDVIILPDEVENTGGRPALMVEPTMAARYFWHNPNAISIAMAKEMFGLSRTAHNLHKDFVIQFADELRKLRREHKR